jgi:hypothetical protein
MLNLLMLMQFHEPVHIQPIPEPGTVGLVVAAVVGLVIVGMMRRGKP